MADKPQLSADLFNGAEMSSDLDIQRAVAAVAGHLGIAARDERLRRGWTQRDLGARAGVSASLVHYMEIGRPVSLETYVRVAAALGLRADFDLVDPRRTRQARAEDPVHAAMGEYFAGRLRDHRYPIAIDDPYQHYQFAGRADLLAWSVEDRAMLHIENRTRFPNLQDAFGSYNAKRQYLPAVLAEHLGLRGGFDIVTHAMVGLWSSEVLHAIRKHESSFRAVCPQGSEAVAAWLAGQLPPPGVTSGLLILDPLAGRRERALVGWPKIGSVRSRYRGYADAVEALRVERRA